MKIQPHFSHPSPHRPSHHPAQSFLPTTTFSASHSPSSPSLQYSQVAEPSESTPLLQTNPLPQYTPPTSLHVKNTSGTPLQPSTATKITAATTNKATNARVKSASSSLSNNSLYRPITPVSNEARKFTEAMKQWSKAADLDYFYSTIYAYYYGKGSLAILMRKSAFQLRLLFSLLFLIFLTHCIDFQQLPTLTSPTPIHQILCYPKFSIYVKFFLYPLAILWCAQWIRIFLDHQEYKQCKFFYSHVLGIHEADVATVQWSEVLVRLEKYSPIPTDQIQITNRIMRKENLSIALFSHPQLLDLKLPLLGTFFSLPLQYAIEMCVFGTIFNALATHPTIRGYGVGKLTEQLKKKFFFMGLLYCCFAWFLSIVLVVYFFFRYGDEYYRNPGAMGSRRFSPLACWKFREYNEVTHLFEQRLNASHQPTLTYLSQFPSEYTIIWIKLLNFIFGAFAGALVLSSIIYPDILIYLDLGFHLTPVFYLGLFTSILAILRSLRPQDHTLFDPVHLMDQIIQQTHYQPTSPWYSRETKQQLSHFFPLRLTLYFRELLSIALAPYMLAIQLPKCSEKILLYFADHLIYKEPLGYILDLAAFEVMDASDDKMVQSMVYFKSTHPTWQPPTPLDSSSSPVQPSTGPSLVNMLHQFYASDEDESELQN